MRSKTGVLIFALMLAGVALAITSGVVIVNGSTARVRTATIGGVPYVAAPDIAKAFGLQFHLVKGKFVFGALGGKSTQEAAVTEFGKWAFNGKLRVRVVDFSKGVGGCNGYYPYGVTIEVANAFNESIAMANDQYGPKVVHIDSYVYDKDNQLLTNVASSWQQGWPSDFPSGAHFKNSWCLRSEQAALLVLSPYIDLRFGKHQNLPVMKFKLVKP